MLQVLSLWKYIKNEWFYTRTAVLVFGTAAFLVCLMIGGAEVFPRLLSWDAHTTAQQIGYALLGVCFGLSNGLVLFGMFRFWVASDKSSRVARRIWFVVMIVGMLRIGLGAALYCFAVYLPQVFKALRQRAQVGSA